MTWSRRLRGALALVVAMLPPSSGVAQVLPAGWQLTREPLCIVGPGARLSRFEVEVADEPTEQARGLMYRREMLPQHGMLFLYRRPHVITMWMKNTYLSLDMIFIEPRGRILRIETRTTPLSERTISSGGPSIAVLELVGGAAKARGMRPGDRVLHPFFSSACPRPPSERAEPRYGSRDTAQRDRSK